jgi:hypothetical protein
MTTTPAAATVDDTTERLETLRVALLAVAREATEAGTALDKIADHLRLDEDGVWSDETGILESIYNEVKATGRAVPGDDA